jgi:hypothetical protein
MKRWTVESCASCRSIGADQSRADPPESANSPCIRATMTERAWPALCRSDRPNLMPLISQFASSRDCGRLCSTITSTKSLHSGSNCLTASRIADCKSAHEISCRSSTAVSVQRMTNPQPQIRHGFPNVRFGSVFGQPKPQRNRRFSEDVVELPRLCRKLAATLPKIRTVKRGRVIARRLHHSVGSTAAGWTCKDRIAIAICDALVARRIALQTHSSAGTVPLQRPLPWRWTMASVDGRAIGSGPEGVAWHCITTQAAPPRGG